MSGKNLLISIIRLELNINQIILITGAVDKYDVKSFIYIKIQIINLRITFFSKEQLFGM